jgi:hypothetical protein
MSLLDAVAQCDDYKKEDLGQMIKLPYIDQIVDQTLDLTMLGLRELIQILETYNYLCMDTSELVDQILWELGDNKEMFLKYFAVISYQDMYLMRNDVDHWIRDNFEKHFKSKNTEYNFTKPLTPEQLSVRFYGTINTLNCIRSNNLRLLKWGAENCKLTTSYVRHGFTNKRNYDIDDLDLDQTLVQWVRDNLR